MTNANNLHFEDLWEQSESFHKNSKTPQNIPDIIQELLLKVNLYQAVDAKELPTEEKTKIKSRTLGEILLTLTNLSLQDNINVFESLGSALQYRSVEFFNKKYSE